MPFKNDCWGLGKKIKNQNAKSKNMEPLRGLFYGLNKIGKCGKICLQPWRGDIAEELFLKVRGNFERSLG